MLNYQRVPVFGYIWCFHFCAHLPGIVHQPRAQLADAKLRETQFLGTQQIGDREHQLDNCSKVSRQPSWQGYGRWITLQSTKRCV